MSATKFYPSAPLEPVTAIEERLERKLNDVSNFNNLVILWKKLPTLRMKTENNKFEEIVKC